MVNGKIKWYDKKKGYGFITCDGNESKDVFVHASALKNENGFEPEIKEGRVVEFDIIKSARGEKATNIKLK